MELLGFGATPFGSPFRLGDEHTIFTVLLLPHLRLILRSIREILGFRRNLVEDNLSSPGCWHTEPALADIN